MVAGATLGILLGGSLGAHWNDRAWLPLVLTIRAPGVIFLSALKAVAVPLVVVSVTLAVANLGELRSMGRAMGYTGAYFLATTLVAVITGIVLVQLIHPGSMFPMPATQAAPELSKNAPSSASEALYGVVTGMFPTNVFAAATEGNVLGLIVVAIFFGAILASQGERAKPVVNVLDTLDDALMRLVRILVWLAPIGLLCLVADRIGKAGGGPAVRAELARLGGYALTVVAGLLIHAVVTLPLVLWLFARRNPARYASGVSDALLTAFGTASSAATMGVTLRSVTEKNRVSPRAAELVIPLGTTVNMNGTALYEAVAVIFIAQASGVELDLSRLLVLALTATLAAVGAAAIPEAGLVTMVLVLGAVGLPATGIGILLSIDWILDRARTSVNVWGDAVGAAVVERRLEPTAPDE
jgi:solute carrier family 1 (high affinity glutamate transporter) protein 1